MSAATVLWLEDDQKDIDKVPMRNLDTSELVNWSKSGEHSGAMMAMKPSATFPSYERFSAA